MRCEPLMLAFYLRLLTFLSLPPPLFPGVAVACRRPCVKSWTRWFHSGLESSRASLHRVSVLGTVFPLAGKTATVNTLPPHAHIVRRMRLYVQRRTSSSCFPPCFGKEECIHRVSCEINYWAKGNAVDPPPRGCGGCYRPSTQRQGCHGYLGKVQGGLG